MTELAVAANNYGLTPLTCHMLLHTWHLQLSNSAGPILAKPQPDRRFSPPTGGTAAPGGITIQDIMAQSAFKGARPSSAVVGQHKAMLKATCTVCAAVAGAAPHMLMNNQLPPAVWCETWR